MQNPFRPILAFCVLMVMAILAPVDARAVPSEVTLYPNSAKVVEMTRVTLQPVGESFKAVVTIPGQAVPDTLTAVLPRNSPLRIDDQSWRQISRQDDAKLADLRRQMQNLKTERIVILSGIQAQEAQIKFWQEQTKTKPKSIEETGAIAALLTRNVKKAVQDKLALEPELEKVDRKIRDLQEEINRIGGRKDERWEVTFLLSGPSAARETTLTLTYTLKGCGWTPLYRLEAVPRDGVVLFTWEAEIWQSSGADWNQVAVHLATLPAGSALAPPDLPPWVIRPRPQVQPKPRKMVESMEAPAAASLAADAQEAPRETRESTYSLWNVGVRNIPAGARQRLKVRSESWTADFVHLVRPSLTPQSFIQAVVKLPEAREIPSGQATFLIDGAILAKRPFSFAGQEGSFTFGSDPLVTSEAVLLSRQSGEKGFITDKQTQEWSWRWEIKNARDTATRFRLEDPLPQVRDERIKIVLKSEPEPTEKTPQALVWIMDCPAGGRQSVLNTVRLEAPKEMELDLGWRR